MKLDVMCRAHTEGGHRNLYGCGLKDRGQDVSACLRAVKAASRFEGPANMGQGPPGSHDSGSPRPSRQAFRESCSRDLPPSHYEAVKS